MKHFFQPYALSPPQRLFLIPYFGLRAIIDPTRGEDVAGFGDVTNFIRIEQIYKKIKSTDQGNKLLLTKPLITEETLNIERLRNLPNNKFGKNYTNYMDNHNFSADLRSPVRFMLNEEHAYIMLRYRQVHDFWHVLSGLPPTLLGEVALKLYEFHITGLPVCVIGGIVGQLKLNKHELYYLYKYYLPWIRRSNTDLIDLLCYDYEKNLDKNLNEVREELKFKEAPIY
jgi:ubiquinone biosynthesis protein COQ4